MWISCMHCKGKKYLDNTTGKNKFEKSISVGSFSIKLRLRWRPFFVLRICLFLCGLMRSFYGFRRTLLLSPLSKTAIGRKNIYWPTIHRNCASKIKWPFFATYFWSRRPLSRDGPEHVSKMTTLFSHSPGIAQWTLLETPTRLMLAIKARRETWRNSNRRIPWM